MRAILLAPVLLSAIAAPVPAQQTRAELRARVDREFRMADRNRDGALTRIEVRRRVVERLGPVGVDEGQARVLTNKYFQRLDRDRNGRVSPAEARAAAGEGFARFDANRDGRLSPRERAAAQRFARHPGR